MKWACMQQHGEVMADCKALSQYGDKGSPPDGRPFTFDLYTVHKSEDSAIMYATAGLLIRVFYTLRAHMHA